MQLPLPADLAAAATAADAIAVKWRALLAAALGPLQPSAPARLRVNYTLGGGGGGSSGAGRLLGAGGDALPLYVRAEAWCDEVAFFAVAVNAGALAANKTAAVKKALLDNAAAWAAELAAAAGRVAACAAAARDVMRDLVTGAVSPAAAPLDARGVLLSLPELLARAAAEALTAAGMDGAAAMLMDPAAPAAFSLSLERATAGAAVVGAPQLAAPSVSAVDARDQLPDHRLLGLIALVLLPLCCAFIWYRRRLRGRRLRARKPASAKPPLDPMSPAASSAKRRARQQAVMSASRAAHGTMKFNLASSLSSSGASGASGVSAGAALPSTHSKGRTPPIRQLGASGGGGDGTYDSPIPRWAEHTRRMFPNSGGSPASLAPHPWVQLLSKSRDRPYFYNIKTRERTWKLEGSPVGRASAASAVSKNNAADPAPPSAGEPTAARGALREQHPHSSAEQRNTSTPPHSSHHSSAQPPGIAAAAGQEVTHRQLSPANDEGVV